jgi:outer membrane lipoprotein-sorting protein
MKKFFLLVLALFSFQAYAIDDPSALIRELNKKFSQVNDYRAHIRMTFDIPGVRMNAMNGKVFFKRPDRFRIRTKGIFFLPKQNPLQNMSAMLLDTSSYTSIISGYEVVKGKKCAIVNIIPLRNSIDLVLGKFWIDVAHPLVMKTQITTKNNGTIETENVYASNSTYTLPDQIIIRLETKKIKISKMMAADLNKKSKDISNDNKLETGTIILSFSDYKINTKFADSEFDKSE